MPNINYYVYFAGRSKIKRDKEMLLKIFCMVSKIGVFKFECFIPGEVVLWSGILGKGAS